MMLPVRRSLFPEPKASSSQMDETEADFRTLASLPKTIQTKKKKKKKHNYKPTNHSHNVKKGDIVWAKAFPYTWWPGHVTSIKGSSVSISFFDCSSKKISFRVSEIKPFEEYYSQISKIVCFKGANAINLALYEISRRTILSLNCCLQKENEREEEIIRVRERFNPIEILNFVHDLGENSWVDKSEIARTTRVSSEIYVYNRYISLCTKIRDEYSASEILGFIRDKAVSLCNSEDEFSADLGVIDWINEYRDFISVCPKWMYRSENEEIENELLLSDSSEGEFDQEKIPDSLYSSELEYDINGLLEENIYLNHIESADLDASQFPIQGGEICILNRIDFSFFDTNDSCETSLQSEGILVNLPSHKPDLLDKNMVDIITYDKNSPNPNSAIIISREDTLKNVSKKRRRNENDPVNYFFKLHKSLVKYPEAKSYAGILRGFMNSNKNPNYPYNDQNALDKFPNWTKLYASPLTRDIHFPKQKNELLLDKEGFKPKSLHIKFPKDFKIPSKEELEKLFEKFGLLDSSKTRVFFYTGAAQVVFLNHKDAKNAYKYAKRKNIFGDINVRFWFDEYESFRSGTKSEGAFLSLRNYSPPEEIENLNLENNTIRCEVIKKQMNSSSSPSSSSSSLGLKSCLKSQNSGDEKKLCKVRFTIET